MANSGLASLAGMISELLAQLESIVSGELPFSHVQPGGPSLPGERTNELQPVHPGATESNAVALVRQLQRQLDRVLFLHEGSALFSSPLPLSGVTTRLVDTLWQRDQFAFAALVLGDSELGPYYYHELRGIVDARRYQNKLCPLPLWGELAHALVRRLNPEEPDYLVIEDIAATRRPTPEEFAWMPRAGSLIILPLRKESIAIGALVLGRMHANSFADAELRLELAEFAAIAARAITSARIQEELHERAGQLVGLQLFTRSMTLPSSFQSLLSTIIEGVAELMDAATVLFAFHNSLVPSQLLQHLLDTPGARIHYNLVGVGLVSTDEPSALFTRLYRLIMWSIEAGQPLFFDPSQPTESPEDLYYNETGRALMTPITIGDMPLGVLYIEAPQNAPGYDEGDMVVLRTATNAIAVALQKAG